MKKIIYKMLMKLASYVAPPKKTKEVPIIRAFHNQSNEDLIIQAIFDLANRADMEEIKSIKLTYNLVGHDRPQDQVFSK